MKKFLKFKRSFVIFAIFSSIISFGYGVNATADEDEYILPVFMTSDVHGYIAEKNGSNYQYLLSYISDKVKDVRGYGEDYDKDRALLLDGGDIYQGNTMSNLLNGNSLAAAFKLMDYDAVTIGNHEFDWGIENTVDSDSTMMDSNLEGISMVNDIPVLISNLYLNGEKVNFAKDYIIIDKVAKNSKGEETKVKIGVIGFAENYDSEIIPSQFISKGYSIKEDFNIPNNIAKELEESGQVDATILLCHKDAKKVVEKMGQAGILRDSAIDIVLGGHSHYNENGRAESGMPYMEPVCYAKAYNYCEMVFNKDENGKIVFDTIDKMENVVVDLEKTENKIENSDELDSNMIVLTDKVIEKVQPIIETKVGYITIEAGTKKYIDGSGEFSTVGGNWASSIYQRGVDSDIAFVNRTGVRYDFKLPEGSTTRAVTIGDIYTTYPFENRIYKYEITYDELLTLLNYGVKDIYHSFFSSIVGIDCYYNDSEVNALVKDGVLIYQNGNWKDNWKNKTVTVATNEYVATTDKVFNDDAHNPMVEWNKTPKLIDTEKIDSECAIKILTEEGKKNNGLLTIDKEAHYILGTYEGQLNDSEDKNIDDESKTYITEINETESLKTKINKYEMVLWISIIVVFIIGIIGIICIKNIKIKITIVVIILILCGIFACVKINYNKTENINTPIEDINNKNSEKRNGIDYLVLVNKQNKLPDDWEANVQLVDVKDAWGDGIKVEKEAYEKYLELKTELEKEGVYIELDSCYRSVAAQQELWDRWTIEKGIDYVRKYVAVPGYSEHHTGLALDICIKVNGELIYENEDMIADRETFAKIHEKLANYGFILRYLEGKEDITGYSYEPWHLRYIGSEEKAQEITSKGLTFEEYLQSKK